MFFYRREGDGRIYVLSYGSKIGKLRISSIRLYSLDTFSILDGNWVALSLNKSDNMLKYDKSISFILKQTELGNPQFSISSAITVLNGSLKKFIVIPIDT